MYKYKFRFLYIYSYFGSEVKHRSDMIQPLLSLGFSEFKSDNILSELQRRHYLRYSHRTEVEKSGIEYDGRKSYYSVGESGYKFLKKLKIDDKDDPRVQSLLAREMLNN